MAAMSFGEPWGGSFLRVRSMRFWASVRKQKVTEGIESRWMLVGGWRRQWWPPRPLSSPLLASLGGSGFGGGGSDSLLAGKGDRGEMGKGAAMCHNLIGSSHHSPHLT